MANTLPDLSAITARLAALEAENAALKAARNKVSFKIHESGVISAYGLNAKFPISLYPAQWARLSGEMNTLAKFMQDNASTIAANEAKRAAK